MMPQLFQVLKCYKCKIFQVHQTKKSNKWECKICGEKQSIKRHYGIGTGQECRLQVQKLNNIRGEIDNANLEVSLDDEDNDTETENINSSIIQVTKSKWSDFLEETEVKSKETTVNEAMYLDDKEVVLEIPKKRKSTHKHTNVYSSNATTNQSTYRNKYKKIKNYVDEDLQINNINDIGDVTTQSDVEINAKLTQKQSAKDIKPIKEFKPPVLNETSKWLQFINVTETPYDNEVVNVADTTEVNVCASKSSGMFSTCDDNDLDGILNI